MEILLGLVSIIGGTLLYCWLCGKETHHSISQSSKYYIDYKCDNCHVIQKVKVDKAKIK